MKPKPPRLVVETLLIMAATIGAIIALVGWLGHIGDTGIAFAVAAPLGFGVIASVVVSALPAHPYARFGLANSLTTIRAGLTAVIGALAFEADRLAGEPTTLAWLATLAGALALALDGLDGYTARRRRESSRFGARFDMEIDALLILLLCVLLHGADKLGPWVYALGLMRYGFVVAGWLWPRLDTRRLLPSQRRKIVCVIQGVVLCLALAPVVAPGPAAVLVAFGLAALVYSFGRDIVFLLAPRNR